MAYRVEIARSAEAELEELYLWIIGLAPHQGAKWFNGLEEAVLSLNQHPTRCPVAPESIDPDMPVRVLHYGRKPRVSASSSPSPRTPGPSTSFMCDAAHDSRPPLRSEAPRVT